MGLLEAKVALVTGTGGGIGRAAATLFAHEGATVVGCDLHVARAEETLELVRGAGGTMTSAAPVSRSRPSTFPVNSRPSADASLACASTTAWLPFPGSSPAESNATLGRSTPRTAVLKAAPR